MDSTKTSSAPQAIRPIPAFLLQRYRAWKATDHAENQAWYKRLADEGQRPRCMVITCCDSRLQVTQLFGAGPGEFFIHRNIASLVPPYEQDGAQHGTSAALEYAVTALKVPHVLIVGHSSCGGVKGCHDMCAGHAPELEDSSSFVGRWMDILRPGYERVRDIEDEAKRTRALEHQAVQVSLENMMTFPFVREAVDAGKLTLHGLWMDIGEGTIESFDPKEGFAPV